MRPSRGYQRILMAFALSGTLYGCANMQTTADRQFTIKPTNPFDTEFTVHGEPVYDLFQTLRPRGG